MQSNVGMYYGYPLAVYDEETGSYGYYTEEDAAEEGWKFNKFNPYPSNTLLLVRFTDAQAAPIKAEWEAENADYRRAPSGDCADVHCTGAVRVSAVRHRT